MRDFLAYFQLKDDTPDLLKPVNKLTSPQLPVPPLTMPQPHSTTF